MNKRHKYMLCGLIGISIMGMLVLVSCTTQQAGAPGAAVGKYQARLYVAGMGGHFANAKVSIDPAWAQPIYVQKLTRIKIGKNSKDGKVEAKKTHPVHDARIDNNDPNTMFWGTYKIDERNNSLHIGKVDLAEKMITLEKDILLPPETKKSGSNICASAQSKDEYMPIYMTNPAFVDVYKKADLSRVRRVFLEGTDADIGKPYKFYHGNSSNDMKKLLITINEAETDHGALVGRLHVILMDMDEFVKGNVKVLNKTVIERPDAKNSFIGFRLYFSPDDKLISISAADRMLILDANSREVLHDVLAPKGNQLHDAQFTPDAQYVMATSRMKTGNKKLPLDGQVLLYGMSEKSWIGKGTSTCLACHKEEDVEGKAVLCGIDSVFL